MAPHSAAGGGAARRSLQVDFTPAHSHIASRFALTHLCDHSASLQSVRPAVLRENCNGMALACQPQGGLSSQACNARSLHPPQAARPAGRAPTRHSRSWSRPGRVQAAQGSTEPASSMGRAADHQGSADAAAAEAAPPPVKLPPPPPPAVVSPQQRQQQRLREVLTFCLPVVLVPLADPVSDHGLGHTGATAPLACRCAVLPARIPFSPLAFLTPACLPPYLPAPADHVFD